MTVTPQRIQIIAADGYQLTGHVFPAAEPKGAVLIVPAMGAEQKYYASFADWLAQHGFTVLTFDYRGIGQSRHGSLRGLKANILDWSRLDCAAALETLSTYAPGKPITWVGHSLGGQIAPFTPNLSKVSKILGITAGSGYWLQSVPSLRRYVWWLWYVVVPISTIVCGYFPGKGLRKVGDLPKDVMLQWRRWCLNPDYSVGAEGKWARDAFAAVTMPFISISVTDDELMSAQNINSLYEFYTNSPKTAHRIAPQDINVKHIGHFGFFRKKFTETLWHAYVLPELLYDKKSV